MRTSRIVKSMSSTSSHWMLNSYGFYRKSGRRRSTVLLYGNCAYSERNYINTEQLVFVSLKIKKKTKKKKEIEKKMSLHRESIAVHLNSRGAQYH